MKPHLKRTWCIAKFDAHFIARMEQILHLYALPYDPAYPLVCFDERPCFLIGERIAPLPCQKGQVAKEHYAFEKNGSCALLACIEPLSGQRLAMVFQRRTKREYALFMQQLAALYPQATKIRVIQDNLNTHSKAAFYEVFDAQQAFELAQRFEFYYTPPSASWLNMVEIEFSALSKQCLNCRIPTLEKLKTQILTLVKERSDKKIKINWQFSIQTARQTLNRHYLKVNPENSNCSKT